jgi:hypothetical protein
MSAYLKQETDGDVVVKLDTAATVTFEWASGVDAQLIRGATDTDRTAIALRRSDGTRVYLYVDTGTTLVVSATAP